MVYSYYFSSYVYVSGFSLKLMRGTGRDVLRNEMLLTYGISFPNILPSVRLFVRTSVGAFPAKYRKEADAT